MWDASVAKSLEVVKAAFLGLVFLSPFKGRGVVVWVYEPPKQSERKER